MVVATHAVLRPVLGVGRVGRVFVCELGGEMKEVTKEEMLKYLGIEIAQDAWDLKNCTHVSRDVENEDKRNIVIQKAIRRIIESWPGAVKRGDIDVVVKKMKLSPKERSGQLVICALGHLGIPVED